MKNFIKMLKNTKGATAIEYGLIAALIAVACITAIGSAGDAVEGIFGEIEDGLTANAT